MAEKKEEVTVVVDDIKSHVTSEIPFCRICHELEFESGKTLEAPCHCSGTVKFAHRDCIQRWCEEKGDTLCEICLQNFEPGYTVSEKARDAAVTIRGSLEVPRRRGLRNPDLEEQLIQREFSSNRWSFFRVVASLFTIVFLLQHVSTLLMGGTDDYPFALLILLIAKMSGIALPIYVLVQIAASFYKNYRNRQRQYEAPAAEPSIQTPTVEPSIVGGEAEVIEGEAHIEHRVEIQSS